MNDLTKNVLVFIVIIVVLLSVVSGLNGVGPGQPTERDYSAFTEAVRKNDVERAVIGKDNRIRWQMKGDGLSYFTISPETDNNTLIGLLEEHDVEFTGAEQQKQSFLTQLLISSFPILLLIGVWIYFMRQMQGGWRRSRRPCPSARARHACLAKTRWV